MAEGTEERHQLQDREVTAAIECHMRRVRALVDEGSVTPPTNRMTAVVLAAALMAEGLRIQEIGELFSEPEP